VALGKRDLKGFIPNIKDRGLGATLGDGGRVGFCGLSKGGVAGTFYELASVSDVVSNLVRGDGVDQLIDLFDDGYDQAEPAQSVKKVIYYEIDPAGGAAAVPGTPALTAGGTGTATCASGGTPYRTRSYCIKITATGNIGDGVARYSLCRNYDVVDTSHQVWEEEKIFPTTTIGPPQKCKIFIEGVNEGNYVEFTEGVGNDFVEGDLWTWNTVPGLPTVPKTTAAVQALASWRDAGMNGIGGTADISTIGCDRAVASTDWDDFHAIATAEWNDNLHPVQIVLSTIMATKTLGVYVIDTAGADWLPTLIADSVTYRTATIPTNGDLNGALELSAIYQLVDKQSNQDGAQVRHRCGSIVGMKARARWQINPHWTARFPFKGGKAIYPWNSKVDNMTKKAGAPDENRTARLSKDGHFVVAWPSQGALTVLSIDNEWAMADPLSDYFLAPYYRVIGGTHVLLRCWFNGIAGSPGISSNDAAGLQKEINATILKPRTVDPNKPGDAEEKPYDAAQITVWAEADVLVTQQLQYSLAIVPVGSKYQLYGYSQLRRTL
jgi:hypothetical protein